MTESLLNSEEREVQRYELFKLCGEVALQPDKNSGAYASTFALFDVVSQLVELNRNLSGIRTAIGDIAIEVSLLREQLSPRPTFIQEDER
jgi:hypothetical protein